MPMTRTQAGAVAVLEQAQPVEEALPSGQLDDQGTQEAQHCQTTIPQLSAGVGTEFKLGAVLAVLTLKLTFVTGIGSLWVSHNVQIS